MKGAVPIDKDVVLIGGGHAHVEVIRQFAMLRPQGTRLTVISREIETPYSGMLPGYLAGHYAFDECHIDLAQLAVAAEARLHKSQVTGLNLPERSVICVDRPAIRFDYLSIDIGSTPSLGSIEGHEYALPLKPVPEFIKRWIAIEARLMDGNQDIHVVVIGGGAGGVEVSLCLHHRIASDLQKTGRKHQLVVHVVTDEEILLTGHGPAVRHRLGAAMVRNGIRVHLRQKVNRVTETAVYGPDNFVLPCDVVVITTHASAPDWLDDTGLALDEKGFISVSNSLQSISHPFVFAAGDIASFKRPLVKNGVHAVRQGPVLARTLTQIPKLRKLHVFIPQKLTLALISTGNRSAIASYGRLAVEGSWVWKIKNWIDRCWINKYCQPQMHNMTPQELMRCGGCGAKVPAEILQEVLSNFSENSDEDILIGLKNPDDAAVMRTSDKSLTVQTVDHFRSFIDDPYLFGLIASNHALSDIYAMGATPDTALAIVTLPFARQDKMADDLRLVLAGARKALRDAEVRLVGGHTGEGVEFSFGLSVTGHAEEDRILRKSGLRHGDMLILTKPLGTGVLLAGWMQGRVKHRFLGEALATMSMSNRNAASVFVENSAHACTDVTGFGLIGHLGEMVKASQVHVKLNISSVPALPGALELFDAGVESTLQSGNRSAAYQYINDLDALQDAKILMDPQTSGGLIAAVRSEFAPQILRRLKNIGNSQACIVGVVTDGAPGRISIHRE